MKSEVERSGWGWKVVGVVFLICLVSVLTQVFWPGKKFMALTRVGGVDVAGMTREEAKGRLAEVYAEEEVDGMMERELEYPMWERLVPFSWVVRAVRSRI
jgi:hypothetical protein